MVYNPGYFSNVETLDQLRQLLETELRSIAAEFAETTALELRQIHVEPTKPREGMIVSADGTDWNPGAGAGAYEYKGGTWVKL